MSCDASCPPPVSLWDLFAAEVMTDAERARRYRDNKRGAPPRQLAPCGTVAAYKRHQRHGEPPCAPCRAAWADWQRTYYARRKGL